MLILLLFMKTDSLNLQVKHESENLIIYYGEYEANAQTGDTLFVTPIPLGDFNNFNFYLLGECDSLSIYYRIDVDLPTDNWRRGIQNTNVDSLIARKWHPWDFYKLRLAIIALSDGYRNFNMQIVKHK